MLWVTYVMCSWRPTVTEATAESSCKPIIVAAKTGLIETVSKKILSAAAAAAACSPVLCQPSSPKLPALSLFSVPNLGPPPLRPDAPTLPTVHQSSHTTSLHTSNSDRVYPSGVCGGRDKPTSVLRCSYNTEHNEKTNDFSKMVRVHVVLTCAFTLALCCAVDAEPSPWPEVVKSVVQLPAIHQTAAHKTSFSRDVTLLRNYVAGSATPPSNIAEWVGKVAALRAKYDIANPAAAHRPRVVISGAGPLGLLTAVLLLLKHGGQHRITILEKTDGKDTRWHATLAQFELDSLLTRDLGLKFQDFSPWIGHLPELEYVFGAMLLAVGVEINYNTMFIFACPDAADDSALVHTVDTPEHSEERHRTFDTTTFCSYGEDVLASELGRSGIQGHQVEAKVRVLIGADGTSSSVRRSTLHGQSDATDSSFPVLRSATASFFVANRGATDDFTTLQTRPVQLYAAGLQPEPLLSHVIVSFDAEGERDAAQLYDILFFQRIIAVTPQVNIRTLGPLFMEYGKKFTREEFSSICQSLSGVFCAEC